MIGPLFPALVLPIVILLHFGCGGVSPSDPAGSTSEAGSPTAAVTTATFASKPERLAVAAYAVNGVDVELLDISRTGADTITLQWQYRTELTPSVRLDAGDDPYGLTRDAYLYDSAHEKKYMVVEDDSGRPVTSIHIDDGRLTVSPDAPLTAWAKFPAPPADVEQVAIHLPGVELFESVALSQ